MDRKTGERARWLSAVLILVGIVAIAVIVRQWPAHVPVHVDAQHAIPAQPLALIEPPPSPRPASTSAAHYRTSRMAPASAMTMDTPAVTITHATAAPVDQPLPAEAPAIIPEPAAPALLAIRQIQVFAAPPAPVTIEPVLETPEDSPGIVELPAVVVTRAVTVAGRGIRTGLRATSAALRAAF